jgi:pimeloyl-ACP methyl ester carboxylesterase
MKHSFLLSKMLWLVLSLISLIQADHLIAKPLMLSFNKLVVNAEIIESKDKQKPFFLILHGSLAWHGMELPNTIQQLLADENYGSLAFSLSLGETNRSGFFDCTHPIISGHDDAQVEIEFWLNQLAKMGYQNIMLVGHSRGGAQMANFALENAEKIKGSFLIAPLVWDKKQVHAAYQPVSKVNLVQQLERLKKQPDSLLSNQNILHCKKATVSGKAFLSYYDELPEKNTPSLLESIKVPTKIYLGDSDPLTKGFIAQKALFSDNKMIKHMMIEDADHFFRDFAAEEIVSDIISSLPAKSH